MRHINIPVFIPHLGCPNQCVFCNQRSISGVSRFDPDSVRNIIDEALTTVSHDDFVEIAFFGGSFTGIERELMLYLLDIADSYVRAGKVKSIRCSTRPDYIDEEIINILISHNVNVVELGLQTTSDKILINTKRNHTYEDEIRACKLITDAGITLIGQMMIGLPGSTLLDELKTAEFIINSGAKGARVYPTVVFRETELCFMAETKKYTPLDLDDAVIRSAEVVKLFRASGVDVIRIGLCASDNLVSDDTYFAGPNHPALGELVENRIYFDRIFESAKKLPYDSSSVLYINVPSGDLSKAVGQKKRNKFLLIDTLGVSDVRFFANEELERGGLSVEMRGKENKCT